MTDKKTNKDNESEQIIDLVPVNEDDTPKSQEDRFIIEYLDCHDVREAGKRAGYAASVMTSGYLYGKFKNPKFQDKFRSVAISREYQDMAFVYSLERKALEEASKQATEKPETAIENLSKLKHTLKQKKQIVGILSPDTAPAQPMVNIGSMTQIQVNLKNVLEDRLKEFSDTK